MSEQLPHYLEIWNLSDPHLLAETFTSHVYTVTSGGETVCYPGDILFTPWHIKPNYISAYDVCQERTYREKLRLIDDALRGDWTVCWGHTVRPTLSKLRKTDGKVVAVTPSP